MNDNQFHARYDVTKKNKFLQFYENNKMIIYSSIIIIIIFFGSLNFYLDHKENKNLLYFLRVLKVLGV